MDISLQVLLPGVDINIRILVPRVDINIRVLLSQRGHRPQGAASQRAQGHQLQLLQEERDRLEDRYNQNQDVVNDLQFAIDVAERGRFGIRSLIRYLHRSGANDSLLNLIRMHGSLNMVKETKKSLEHSIVAIKEELRALG
ncbi:hypothetical protein BASA83_009224 [Batrachochytrium salamandrivorans]|nr:hypothetical protein BASA83_009224 [Batrachochytrium salamandrivorans]